MEGEQENIRQRSLNRENKPQTDQQAQNNVPNNPSISEPPNDRTSASSYMAYLQQRPRTQGSDVQFQSAKEYAEAVRQWMWQYYWWNQMNMFWSSLPFYAASCMPTQPSAQGTGAYFRPGQNFGEVPVSTWSTPHVSQGQPRPDLGRAAPRQEAAPAPGAPGFMQRAQEMQRRTPARGREYKIPQLWKRVAAEFIDFLLLFTIKLGIMLMTMEYVGLTDFQNYDLEQLDQLFNQTLDYNVAFALTSELIIMEVINRIFICLFEALCLRRGIGGFPGGTTPGKRMMGLRVVSCDEMQELGNGRVRIIPAQDIGFWNALVRSVVKNFSLAFFFPVCFTAIFFQHGRAAYDILGNSIVVELTEEDIILGHL